MRSRSWAFSLTLASLLGSCRPDAAGSGDRRIGAPEDTTPPASSVAAVAPPADSASPPQATTGPVERRRRGRPVPLRGVRAALWTEGAARYDRVVFEFDGDSVAGYSVAYADRVVRHCASGDAVALQGMEHIIVRFSPAQAHDQSGNPTPAQRELVTGLRLVKELKLVCDFEGQVEWVLGLEGRLRYRVTELTAPPRVAIDVVHPR